MRTITWKGLAALVLSLVSATSAVLAASPASPASGEPGTVTCVLGSVVHTFSPPLTNTLKQTTITSHRQLGACTSTTRPDITTGASDGMITIPASCTRPLVGTPVTGVTITWNTQETSTADLNAASTVVQGQLVTTYTGSITAGLFAGSSMQWVETMVADPLLCSTTGLPSMFGLLETQITSLA